MGSRGPARKPTTLGILEGSRRSVERAGTEPQPDKGKPRCPSKLNAAEKAIWKHTANVLNDMGVLTIADGGSLARYCQMLAEWWRHKAFVDEHGISYEIINKSGTPCYMTYPEPARLIQLDKAISRIEKSFGLTAAARAEISIDPKINKPVVRARSRA